MSILNEINQLNTNVTKSEKVLAESIDALEAKGVEVPAKTRIRDIPDLIRTLVIPKEINIANPDVFRNAIQFSGGASATNFKVVSTKPPSSTPAYDLSYDQDDSIMGWYSSSDDTFYVSSLEPYNTIVFDANIGSNYYFSGTPFTGTIDLTGVKLVGNQSEFLGSLNAKKVILDNVDASKCTSMASFFSYGNCSSISFNGIDTSGVKDMSRMFYYCSSLGSLDLSDFDTSSVTSMCSMFQNCYSLTNLDVVGFTTKNVTDMSSMFRDCSSLQTINLSTFDVNNVTQMQYMFSGCSEVSSIPGMSWFYTDSLQYMEHMFHDCASIPYLNLSGFRLEAVEDMSYAFDGCSVVHSIDFPSSSTTDSLERMECLFENCKQLESLDLSCFHTSGVTDMNSVFYNCQNLTSINFGSYFSLNNVTSMRMMFANCYVLPTLVLDDKYPVNCEDMAYLFYNCHELNNINLENWGPSPLRYMSYMFEGCSSLTELDLGGIYMLKVEDMTRTFYNCTSLKSIYFYQRPSSSTTLQKLTSTFAHCQNLQYLNLTPFNTVNVTDMSELFYDCQALEGISFSSNFKTDSVTDMSYMFANCYVLTNLNVAKFNTAKCEDMSFMFADCKALTYLNLYFDTSSVMTMFKMFFECENIESISGLENFQTNNVSNMTNMFTHCKKLTSIDLRNATAESLTAMSSIFWDCAKCTTIHLEKFRPEHVLSSDDSNANYAFYEDSALTTIYCNYTWSSNSHISSQPYLFYGCTSLPGYSSSKVSGAYAKSTSQGGYFTLNI